MTNNKFAVVYGFNEWSEAHAQFIAKNHDLLVIDMINVRTDYRIPYETWIARIKKLNPKIIVLGYHALASVQEKTFEYENCNPNENWFIHDSNGQRIKDAAFQAYLMDIANSNYIQNWINETLEHTNPLYDGVMIDAVWGSIDDNTEVTFTSQPPQDFITNWRINVINFLKTVKVNLPNKLIVINTGEGWRWNLKSTDFLSQVDGTFIEAFYHADWQTEEEPRDISGMLDLLIKCGKMGKMALCGSGNNGFSQKVLDYTYAMYYMGMNSKSYFNFTSGGYFDPMKQYFASMNKNLIDPMGAYLLLNGVYTRDFRNGKATANLNTHTGTLEVTAQPQESNTSLIIAAAAILSILAATLLLFANNQKGAT